jgi:hypothetical protein
MQYPNFQPFLSGKRAETHSNSYAATIERGGGPG